MGLKFKDLPSHVQRNIVKSNPGLFPGLETEIPQPDQRRKVQDKKLAGGEERRRFRIQFVCLRRRLLDEHDNLRSALKPVVDRITERLGFAADNDERLQWEYHQIKTKGKEGVVVLMEII
jgi:hypothetical protein